MTAIEVDQPLLTAQGLGKWYGRRLGCRDISFELYEGEVLAVVGESGSGKSTLLQLLSTQLQPSSGRIHYRMRDGITRDVAMLSEAERRFLFRTDWGYVHQEPALGLRMSVSAGANVGARLMRRNSQERRRTRGRAASHVQVAAIRRLGRSSAGETRRKTHPARLRCRAGK
jgi:putative phosphonate transport system ATP-binding protein